MQVFWDVWWAVWLAMLVVGDPIANFVWGEKASDTHFLATHISVSFRVPLIAWIAWHFLEQHKTG